MKAVSIVAPNDMQLVDLEVPKIGPDEILIRSKAVGICHSDYDLLAGKYIIPLQFPVIPGHEWSGEVAEVGSGVTTFKSGDRVVGVCVIGDDHFGFSISGAAAEYFVVRPDWLHKVPDEISFARAALVEPFSCGYYAVRRADNVDGSDTGLVFGAGPIGLGATGALSARGARVIMADPAEYRGELARQLGADEVLDPTADDFADRVLEVTGGRGPSVVVEASGRPAAMAAAIKVAGFAARLVNIGINVGDSAMCELGLIQSKGLQIRGTIGSPGVWPETLRFPCPHGSGSDADDHAKLPTSSGARCLCRGKGHGVEYEGPDRGRGLSTVVTDHFGIAYESGSLPAMDLGNGLGHLSYSTLVHPDTLGRT